eukprot:12886868-Prorocentrum_lima.AAC.1
MIEWIASIKREMQNFQRLERLQEATPQEKSSYLGRILPCRMVFVKEFQESQTTKTWKARKSN